MVPIQLKGLWPPCQHNLFNTSGPPLLTASPFSLSASRLSPNPCLFCQLPYSCLHSVFACTHKTSSPCRRSAAADSRDPWWDGKQAHQFLQAGTPVVQGLRIRWSQTFLLSFFSTGMISIPVLALVWHRLSYDIHQHRHPALPLQSYGLHMHTSLQWVSFGEGPSFPDFKDIIWKDCCQRIAAKGQRGIQWSWPW